MQCEHISHEIFFPNITAAPRFQQAFMPFKVLLGVLKKWADLSCFVFLFFCFFKSHLPYAAVVSDWQFDKASANLEKAAN